MTQRGLPSLSLGFPFLSVKWITPKFASKFCAFFLSFSLKQAWLNERKKPSCFRSGFYHQVTQTGFKPVTARAEI